MIFMSHENITTNACYFERQHIMPLQVALDIAQMPKFADALVNAIQL